MKYINTKLLDDIITLARNSSRKRKIYNFHDTLDERIHRMLNALEIGTYVQPHKHENPDKTEAFIILKGKVLVIIYDDVGGITEYTLLSASEGNYGIEIPPGVWHSIISLENGSVVYEVKDGPYSESTDKDFAPWAPKEGEEGCEEYIRYVLKQCRLQ